ncbi:MAG: hypothetical protein U5S82_02905 [Gammaproteobacteria bacterium]|nr:hypothetical protein [Gammaproteobacteria bacterium]
MARHEEGGGAIAVDGRFCSNNGEALMAAAVAGLGIALLPEFIIHEPWPMAAWCKCWRAMNARP